VLTSVLHRAVYAFQGLRRLLWFFTRPVTFGVHAVPITPAGELVLVKLSYARGWRLPGGGRKAGEAAEEAMLRELREEIGLISFGSLQEVTRFEHRPDFRKDQSRLFVVRGVV
jgi:ADP-ribose pyrophosphatase YjhB (NUDIX family)